LIPQRLGATLEACQKLRLKAISVAKLKEALLVVRHSMSPKPIDRTVKSFTKWLETCVKAGCGHSEHLHRLQMTDALFVAPFTDAVSMFWRKRALVALWSR